MPMGQDKIASLKEWLCTSNADVSGKPLCDRVTVAVEAPGLEFSVNVVSGEAPRVSVVALEDRETLVITASKLPKTADLVRGGSGYLLLLGSELHIRFQIVGTKFRFEWPDDENDLYYTRILHALVAGLL